MGGLRLCIDKGPTNRSCKFHKASSSSKLRGVALGLSKTKLMNERLYCGPIGQNRLQPCWVKSPSQSCFSYRDNPHRRDDACAQDPWPFTSDYATVPVLSKIAVFAWSLEMRLTGVLIAASPRYSVSPRWSGISPLRAKSSLTSHQS